ncbi:MAG: diguanylate cyclase [Pseudomonadota bacterium]
MERIASIERMAPARWGVLLLAGNCVVALSLCLATYFTLRAARGADVLQAQETADNIAHSLSVEIASDLRLVDHALKSIASSAYAEGAPDSEPDPARIMAATKVQRALVPSVAAISYADAHGIVSSEYMHGNSPMIAGEDFFREAMQTDGSVLSEPMLSKALGEWYVVLARRLDAPDSSARGVLFAVITSRRLTENFRPLALGDAGAISLRSDALNLVARYSASDPQSTNGLGTNTISADLRAALKTSPDEGHYTTRTALDGIERVNAYRRVPGYPLILLAGLDTAQFLAPLRVEAIRQWSFTAVVILLITMGSLYGHRLHRSAFDSLRYAAQLARQQNIIIESEWVGMLRARNREITWVNKAATRILGHAREKLIGASTRILYADEETYDRIGREGYPQLRKGAGYHTEVRVRTASGDLAWIDFSGANLTDDETVWMFVNIDALKHSEQHAQEIALHDALTGLANRRLLDEQLRLSLAQASRKGHEVAVCFMDLDGFKPVNDQYGHDAGDEVLRQVADRMQREVRDHDLVARIGGDEFVIVLVAMDAKTDVDPIIQRCMAAVKEPVKLADGQSVSVGCCIGVAFGSDSGWSAERALEASDAAMYRGKHAGKGRIVYATETIAAAR